MNVLCNRSFFLGLAFSRGYTLNKVMPCVVAQDGDEWTIDTEHPAYPRTPMPGHEPLPIPAPEPMPTRDGPGTELKALLAKIGITSSPDCKCNRRAIYMDEQGCDWCEANIDEIVGWLRETAAERGLPFLDIAGRVLVRRAIANARRKEAQ